MRIFTSTQQRAVEEGAMTRYGMTIMEMTQHAAADAFDVIRELPVPMNQVLILCGKGGNGGDGFALADLMDQAGIPVYVILCAGEPSKAVSQELLRTVREQQIPVLDLLLQSDRVASLLRSCSLIVDAVFGIGLSRSLPSSCQTLFRTINQLSQVPVVSLDVPSGIDSDSGTVLDDALMADYTISFMAAKPASLFKGSAPYFGKCLVRDAGFSGTLLEEYATVQSLDQEETFSHFPHRSPTANKGTYGKLTCLCGSAHYRGAALLATKAAYYSGAGLVQLVSEKEVLNPAILATPEMTLYDLVSPDDVTHAIRNSAAVLAGCGLAANDQSARLTYQLLDNYPHPFVLDAQSLNAIVGELHRLKHAKAPVILTPHPGEFARLIGKPTSIVLSNRIQFAGEFAKEYGLYLVLKSENTCLALPDGRVYVDHGGSSGLAKAGSGDLLAGLIAGFLAQGLSPQLAASMGILTHSGASLLAEQKYGMISMTASMVAECIPEFLKEKIS